MKRTIVKSGVYQSEDAFWIRPVITGRRTWRKLRAIKLKPALDEAAGLLVAHRQSASGSCRSPLTKGTDFAEVADMYLEAGCPNSLDEGRDEKFVAAEAWRLEYLKRFYGTWALDDIKRGSLMKYRTWRITQISRGSGARTTQIDWCTLSNVLNFAVRSGIANFNYIAQERPRLRADNPRGATLAEKIAHCREFAPADGNELNLLAHFFFAERESEAIGFQMLFEAFTSCRSSEARRLRIDATNTDQPGFIQGNHLFIARSKHGVYPYVQITPDLKDFLECHQAWHQAGHSGNPWWFPAARISKREPDALKPLGVLSLNAALRRATKHLGLPKRSAHGLRSFYATRRRGDGATEAQIAAEMGITSIALLEQVYGGRPPNWDGMKKISYWPDNAAPAWHKWKPGATRELDFGIEAKKIVQMQ